MAAAVDVARGLGLRVDAPSVLSDRGNVLVHLSPSPVVARVATATAAGRRDPAAWLAREVAVAATVHAAGGPVVPPTGTVDPGPHTRDGLALTLWDHVEHRAALPDPRSAGEALAALHDAAAGHPGPLPYLAPATDQVTDALDAHQRRPGRPDAAAVDALRARHTAVLADLPAPDPARDLVLHGDAHPGNLLCAATAAGGARWLWTDLEETCRGPVRWDLAVLRGTTRLDGAAAVRAWAAATGARVPTPAELAPFAAARAVEAAAWVLGMAAVDPARYAGAAPALVAAALD